MTSKSHGAPFIHSEKTAPYIYFTHIAALLPCIVFAVFYYGIRALILILFSSILFCICDNLFAKISRRDQIHMGDYFDLSSIASGIVFALMLPPDTSLFIAFAGVFFGSVVAKQFFGGAGNNILNPACAARLFVGITFPASLLVTTGSKLIPSSVPEAGAIYFRDRRIIILPRSSPADFPAGSEVHA